jgi:hypothetical protein
MKNLIIPKAAYHQTMLRLPTAVANHRFKSTGEIIAVYCESHMKQVSVLCQRRWYMWSLLCLKWLLLCLKWLLLCLKWLLLCLKWLLLWLKWLLLWLKWLLLCLKWLLLCLKWLTFNNMTPVTNFDEHVVGTPWDQKWLFGCKMQQFYIIIILLLLLLL